MRPDSSSTSQRINRLLASGRLAGTPGPDGDPGGDPGGAGAADGGEVWPDSWPPGQIAGPADGSGAGLARWLVGARAAVAIGVLALIVVVAVIALQLRGPSAGAVVPSRDSSAFSTAPATPAVAGTAAPVAPVVAAGAPDGVVQPVGTPTDPALGTMQPSVGLFRVYVVGQVRRPAVVSLAPGARVEDAVDAAGGATSGADLTVMNLARKVVDGERIVVPRPGQKVPTADPVPAPVDDGTAGAAGAGTPGPTNPVDLNTATVAELDALPGVGPVLAGRIVAWRQQNGQFKTVDDLGEVSGIGDATLAKLRPLVRV